MQTARQAAMALAVAGAVSIAQPSLCDSAEPAVLVQSHVIFRHGARTPVFWDTRLGIDTSAFRGKCAGVNSPPGAAGPHAVPSAFRSANLDLRGLDGESPRPHSAVDQHQLELVYEECRAGQLTSLGAQQSASLGKALRERYSTLAQHAREGNALYIRTSNVARCVATLQFVLGELFPTDAGVFRGVTATSEEEYLYPNPTHCQITATLMHNAKRDWEAAQGQADAESKAVVDQLRLALPPSAFAALRIAPGSNFVRVRDYLVSYHAHGLPKPWSELDDEVAQKAQQLGTKQVAAFMNHHNKELSKLSSQAGVGNLLRLVHDSLACEGERMSLISAHDTTLMPLLSALEVWDGETWPDFCAWIAFELYSDNTVHVVFNGQTVRHFASKQDFDRFLSSVLPQGKKSWKEFCDEPHLGPASSSASSSRGDTW